MLGGEAGDSLAEMVGIRVRFEGGRAKSGCSLCNLTEALQTGLRGRRLSAGARAVLQCRTVIQSHKMRLLGW